MFDEIKKYKNQGHFTFKCGDNLKNVSNNVPNMQGVYYVIKLSKGSIELIYIGKSGTIQQNGQFKEQGLKGRLNNKQDGVKRQLYFETKCRGDNIDALDVHWFVTIDSENQDLPSYVEALLMQRYFEIYGHLPMWNKCF